MRFLKTILFLLITAASFAQGHFADHRVQRQLELRGVWGYGQNVSNSLITKYKRYGAKGIHKIGLWKDLEPINGGYDLIDFAADVKRFVDSGLYVTIQLGAGNDAPISGSTHWLVDIGVDTFYSIGGNDNGPWPDSYNQTYKDRLTRLYDTVYKKIKATLPASKLKYVIGHYGVFGSTGDIAPYKGNCNSPTDCYGIDDDDTWVEFEFEMLDSIKKVINRNSMLLVGSINTANDHRMLDQFVQQHPFGMDKAGDLSHDMLFTAEKLLYEIPKTNKRGEVQGYPLSPTKPYQDDWQTFVVAVCGKLDYLNLPIGYFNNVLQGSDTEPDSRVSGIFATYAPHNEVASATKAFIQLADKLDYADSIRFTTNTFGAMITPAQYNIYNNQLNNINTSDKGESNKKFLRLNLIESYLSSARETAINNWGATYGATMSGKPGGDQHYIDCGVGMMKNHELHITQINPDGTSEGAYRVGGDTSIYGRFARKFNTAGDPMEFDIDNKWAGGRISASIQYTITYLNDNTGTWSLFARTSIGFSLISTTTNTNTGKWKQLTVTVPNHVLGSSTDFSLIYGAGAKTTFSIIELAIQ
jgi:hypothetical protein